jgi:hypothetical protein
MGGRVGNGGGEGFGGFEFGLDGGEELFEGVLK